jgi:hypothetical protein
MTAQRDNKYEGTSPAALCLAGTFCGVVAVVCIVNKQYGLAAFFAACAGGNMKAAYQAEYSVQDAPSV